MLTLQLLNRKVARCYRCIPPSFYFLELSQFSPFAQSLRQAPPLLTFEYPAPVTDTNQRNLKHQLQWLQHTIHLSRNGYTFRMLF